MAGQFLGTYDPKKVNLNINGYTVSGFAEGTFIKIERVDPEIYKLHVGAHGEAARTKNPNEAGKVTFILKKTSPANIVLNAMKALPLPVVFGIANTSETKYVAGATNAWFSKWPAVEFAMEETNVEWELTCDELTGAFIP